jgi:hypothetical protein
MIEIILIVQILVIGGVLCMIGYVLEQIRDKIK